MRCRVSAEGLLVMNVCEISWSGPEHASAGCQQYCAKQPSQPGYRKMRAQMRSQQPTGYRTNQQGTHEIGINVAQPEMQQAGHAGEYDGVDDVGADHDLR